MSEEKNPKRLLEEGLDYFKRGNFCMADKTLREVLAKDGKYGEEAKEMLKKLKFDYVELYIGIATLILLATLYVYFGFIR